jgi:hypothetical protein
MKKMNETLRWFKDEMTRVKVNVARDLHLVDGKRVNRMDAVSL